MATFADYDESLLWHCPVTESGGYQCEAWLTEPGEEHEHFISQATVEEAMYGSR